MSNIPPNSPYVNYPRSGSGADATRLRLLADGYFGLNTVFVINVVLNLAVNSMSRATNPNWTIIIGILIATFVLVVFLTLPHTKKVGEGLGWQPSGHIIASVLIGLNSAICCGAIGYIVVQSMAGKVLKEAGAPRGFFGYKKADLYAFIDQMGATAPPSGPI